MFRQFQKNQWSEMSEVMAPCHGTMGPKHPVSLLHVLRDTLEKYTIITINIR